MINRLHSHDFPSLFKDIPVASKDAMLRRLDPIPVKDLSLHSQEIEQGDIFLASGSGDRAGSQYIPEAIKHGAVIVISEQPVENISTTVPIVVIPNLHEYISNIAARFYKNPANNIDLIGITGTNGKTSVAYFCAQALSKLTQKSIGYIGTLGYGVFPTFFSSTHTTPDIVSLNKMLAYLSRQSVTTATLEISSHALAQDRIQGIALEVGVITNVSRDHMDYHKTMDQYFDAKMRLFTRFVPPRVVLNGDDKRCCKILSILQQEQFAIAYGFSDELKELGIPYIKGSLEKQHGTLSYTVHLESSYGVAHIIPKPFGITSIHNLLATIAILKSFQFSWKDILEAVAVCEAPPGRMECIMADNAPKVIIDYAHTPDALSKLLQDAKSMCIGKLSCVFGCGGERDQGKRAQMGFIAASYADEVIITNDNPRYENPQTIVQKILTGIPQPMHHISVVLDRYQAITQAITQSAPQDMVIIAGKGHEAYQEIEGVKHQFSDRVIVEKILRNQRQ